MDNCQRVVIVGAGFGGLSAAVKLAKLRVGHECVVTVIDRNTHHLYTPLTYEVATGWMDPHDEVSSAMAVGERELAEGVSVNWDDLRTQFAPRGINVVYDEVGGVDWAMNEVILTSGKRVPFDHLVLATGGAVDHYGITGLADHSHNLYSLRQAFAIRRHLHALVMQRIKNEIPFIRVMIGGAGPAGVEFAAELARCMRKLVRIGKLTPSDYSIEIVEANNRVLPTFHKDMSKWARTRLESLGVRLVLDACIKGAHKDHVVLVPRPLREGEKSEDLVCDFRKESEKEVTTDLLVWAGGVKANPLLGSLGLPLDRRGKVETDMSLRVRGKDNVWALGDAASISDPKTKMPVPPLAQAAIKQSDVLSMNIIRAMRKEPLLNYDFPHMHAIVPLGATYGLAEVFGIRFKGHIVTFLRLAADARYYFNTFPFAQAWKIFWTGARVYRRND